MMGTVPSRAEVSSKAFLSIPTPADQADNFPELEERLQVSDLECAKEGGNILPTSLSLLMRTQMPKRGDKS